MTEEGTREVSGDAFDRPLSKTEYVVQRLRQELQSGALRPGTQLRQAEVSTRYGVSATPVREALRRLEADGVIDYAPHRGATVNEMPRDVLYDLYRFRAEVEKLLVELAVERADGVVMATLRSRHEELCDLAKSGAGAEELSDRNRELHVAIMRAGSRYIADRVLRPLWEKVIPTSQSQWDRSEHVERFLQEHEAILSAMEEGDAAEAGRRMAQHVHGAFEERQTRSRASN